jgi:hypothetical protein
MSTLLHRLKQVLREYGTAFNSNDQIAPAAILWTDGERQWEPLVAQMRADMPHLLTLGAYDPATRSGPAIYLKTLIAGAIPEHYRHETGVVPILYLPGIQREDIRAREECAPSLQPLAELQFRGTLFLQRGGSDWTVYAFLVNPEYGLGLDVAKDQATQSAIAQALLRLAYAPVGPFMGKRLEASDFQDLAHGDAAHHLLLWLDDPAVQRKAWAGNDWSLFVARCIAGYGFDPNSADALMEASRLLGSGQGAWGLVWSRFVAAPRHYPNIPQALRQSKPPQMMLTLDPHWPQDNDDGETALRAAFDQVAKQASHLACTRLVALDQEHGMRRAWVWSALGQAPLAAAVEHLATAARLIPGGLPGQDLDSIAAAYRDHGWQVDASITRAVQAVRRDTDLDLISTVIQAVYPEWLDRVNAAFATRFQAAPVAATPVARADGRCILFADGLRYDVGQTLLVALRDASMAVDSGWSFAALPTVTATAKPAQAPLDPTPKPRLQEAGGGAGKAYGVLRGDAVGADFAPSIAATGKVLTSDGFKQLLEANQVQVLDRTETGDPSGCAWTEHGTLDHAGHAEEVKLCRRITEEIESLRERIADLLAAGWAEVVVTTDHGWMLVPGGMPKHVMPAYLSETRWSRSAVVKAGSDLSAWKGPVAPWAWNPAVSIAMAPGCSAFIAGKAYAHGGLSLQECILPRLTVRRSSAGLAQVRIRGCVWKGMRAVVRIEGAPIGSVVSIRVKAGDAATTISQQGVPITSDPAEARLLIPDDAYIGQSAAIVVCDASGAVLGKRLVTVSEEETA